ncbi:molybdate ABC transporter substrate-binding protein [Rhodoligotrophos defluvii]|uniref:molybdate ABC transporter substrate-binding protein n=1 Tax=Rhodoligotrophos defluvii TaxID=2561934 RepID=UPI0010C9CDF1|nr:molybdate ABC transporter substrate-binding protein [Rhodoligotrophos defluvii]
MRRFFGMLLTLAGLALAGASSDARADGAVTVFAAASLTDALQTSAEAYTRETGQPLRFSFASSSTLARQIELGAPAQIFASADEQWMDYLAKRQMIVAGSRTSPIGNSLVLVAPAASAQQPVELSSALDLPALLGPEGRLSVGDPDHVPAGIYARQALTKLGLWRSVEPRLARADNVRAALALVERGEAPLGIVYATDARQSDKVKVLATFPAEVTPPITYPFAIASGQDRPEVRQAFAFITGPKAQEIYRTFGFKVK